MVERSLYGHVVLAFLWALGCNEGAGTTEDYPCLAEDDCLAGWTCQGGRCSPPPMGQPCGVDDDCLAGYCITDLSGTVRVCSTPCLQDDDCSFAQGYRCGRSLDGRYACMTEPSGPTGTGQYGDPCVRADDCLASFLCADGACTVRCSSDDLCPQGWECRQSLCQRQQEHRGCESVACISGSCVTIEGLGPLCTFTCMVEAAACPVTSYCQEMEGPSYCVPDGSGLVGDPCGLGGDLSCGLGLFCLTTGAGDPGAYCTLLCSSDQDCPGQYACVDNGRDRICRPAPQGLGERQAGQGEDCTAHGDTDCRPGLICARTMEALAICSVWCDDDPACPEGTSCQLYLGGDLLCLPGDGAGGLGTNCSASPYLCDSTQGAFCVASGSQDPGAFCSLACLDGGSCPQGYYCDPIYHYCRPGEEGEEGKIGDPCPRGGLDCSDDAICASDIYGSTFCTRSCLGDQDCPPDLPCQEALSGSSICAPPDAVLP